jgi:hypothetical protein
VSQSILVDDSRFQAALKEYLKYNNRTIPQILNAKTQDLMFKAGKETPLSKMTPEKFKQQQTAPANIAKVAREIYKKRGGFSSGVGFGQIYRATKESMAKRKLGRGFMRSGFFKAGQKIRNADPSRIGKQSAQSFDPSQPSRAVVTEATPSRMESLATVQWKAKNGRDASEKQAIVDAPLAAAVGKVAADMWVYINRKMTGKAREVSA